MCSTPASASCLAPRGRWVWCAHDFQISVPALRPRGAPATMPYARRELTILGRRRSGSLPERASRPRNSLERGAAAPCIALRLQHTPTSLLCTRTAALRCKCTPGAGSKHLARRSLEGIVHFSTPGRVRCHRRHKSRSSSSILRSVLERRRAAFPLPARLTPVPALTPRGSRAGSWMHYGSGVNNRLPLPVHRLRSPLCPIRIKFLDGKAVFSFQLFSLCSHG